MKREDVKREIRQPRSRLTPHASRLTPHASRLTPHASRPGALHGLRLYPRTRTGPQSGREFAAKEILPNIKENDRNQTFDTTLLPKMAEAGLLGISVPVRYGGAGFDYISLGIVSEELEYADTSARVIISVHNGLNSLGVFQWGTEEQKQMFLTPQATGREDRRLLPDRAGRRHRCGGPALLRQKRWRRLHHHRREDVDQPVGCGRPFPVVRQDRPAR